MAIEFRVNVLMDEQCFLPGETQNTSINRDPLQILQRILLVNTRFWR